MEYLDLITGLVAKVPVLGLVLSALGALVVVGQVVVVLTPSQSDDEAVAKVFQVPVLGSLLKALAAFAPIQKK